MVTVAVPDVPLEHVECLHFLSFFDLLCRNVRSSKRPVESVFFAPFSSDVSQIVHPLPSRQWW